VCLIVDANVAGLFLARSSAIRKWLGGRNGDPRLVAAGKLKSELAKIQEVRVYLVELERAGRLRSSFGEEALHQKENLLQKRGICLSNDLHVLALALVSGSRTIATMDGALAKDFRNKAIVQNPRGSVYRNPDRHGHLLCHTRSCGVRA
jgi:hypothetical protein